MLLTAAFRRLLVGVIFSAPLLLAAAPVSQTLLPRARVDVPQLTLPASQLAWLQQHREIRVGVWLPAHPPYVVDTDPQSFEGLMADYLSLLQRALPLSFNIIRYPDHHSALQALNAGDIDLLPATPQLAQQPGLALSDAWLADHAVLVHQPIIELNGAGGLAGKTLVYVGDDSLRRSLQRAYPQARLVARDDYYSAMAAVANDENVVMWSNDVTASEINARIYENRLTSEKSSLLEDQSLIFVARQEFAPLITAINEVRSAVPTRTFARMAEAWRLATPLSINSAITLSPEQRAWVQQHPVVPVLITNTHEPMTFINDKGEESGFTISLLKRIGQQSGITFRWQNFDNLAAMRAHLRQHPESLIALADASAGGGDGVIYSRPYLISSWVLVTRKESAAVQSLADMNGRTVAVYPGSYYLPALRAQFPQVKFVEENFSLETVFSLWTRSLDGAVLPQTAAGFFLKSYLADRFKMAMILPIPPLKMAMATTEQNRTLLTIIDSALIDISPQAMDAQLSGWQLRFTLERLDVWGRYQNIIVSSIAALIVIGLMLGFFFWRNRLLKSNLAVQQNLRRRLQIAKSRVDKISESKSMFLSQMSHEIRTPMNALIGLLELENQGRSSPQQRKNNIAVAYESARSLLMLLGDILDMAKIESGTFKVRSIPLSLTETLNSISTLFRYSADEKDITLVTRVEVRDDRILFDPVMLKQIISNLLSNAIKFTAEGEVEVVIYQAAKAPDEHAHFVLEVCDTGVGLSAEQQQAIFEPFVQVESSRAAHHGTGLGLSICRQLADLLGGTLEVESTPDEGTTFIFRFSAPVWQGPLVDKSVSLPQVAPVARNILIVDDHPPNRLLLSQQLAFAGHRSLAVEDGQAALHAWQQAQPPFDLVITDCNMPVMNGFELVRALRQLETERGLAPQPMFGLTAMAEQEVMAQAKQAGMTDCLFKPVELGSLLARINGLQANEEGGVDPNIVLTLDKLAQSQPEIFNQLIGSVLAQNQRDGERLTSALAQQNMPQLKQVAHSLLGGARTINALALADASRQLELAVDAGQYQRLSALVAECRVQIDTLKDELQRALGERKA
ncbi:transporter substrate-binding domain-containing protein [Erwinia aphidicola]|nr:ATP-binding protein [Erwinia aphidicola]MBD1377762.1 transporter substrate-binding domain-containing protein [Erwinia aphidicola]